jgi:hypothetical protein
MKLAKDNLDKQDYHIPSWYQTQRTIWEYMITKIASNHGRIGTAKQYINLLIIHGVVYLTYGDLPIVQNPDYNITAQPITSSRMWWAFGFL